MFFFCNYQSSTKSFRHRFSVEGNSIIFNPHTYSIHIFTILKLAACPSVRLFRWRQRGRQWIWTICWVELVVEEQGSSLWNNGFTKCLSAPAGGPLLRLRPRYWYNVISSRPFSSFIASALSLSRIRSADPSDFHFAFLSIVPASLPRCSLSNAMR